MSALDHARRILASQPHLSNTTIAKLAKCSENYVRSQRKIIAESCGIKGFSAESGFTFWRGAARTKAARTSAANTHPGLTATTLDGGDLWL